MKGLLRKNIYYTLIFSAVSLFIFSCSRKHEKSAPKFVNEAELLQNEVSTVIDEELKIYTDENYITVDADTLLADSLINKFYSGRNYFPVWDNKGKFTSDADSILNFICDAKKYGLISEDYFLKSIEKKQCSVFDSALNKFNVNKLAEVDLLFTDAFFRLCVHLHKGRINPDSLTVEWKGAQMDTDAVQLLNHALSFHKIRETLEGLEPKAEQYQLLKKNLSEFRNKFANNSWDSLPPIENDTVIFYEKLKQRLLKSEDYDSTLVKNDSVKLARAIQSFQRKHGLNADGKIGKNTIKLLNKSAEDHIHHLEMSMERWRWEKPQNENRFVWINIPSYSFRLIDSDSVVIKSRIICGLPDKQSPELNSSINYFIIYPYWNVPFSIATKEFLPILKRDTGYLRKRNIEVLDGKNNLVETKKIKWKKFTEKYFPYKLRQRDGDDNTLGVLKFIFPNKFGVYLHDTNAHNLFGKEVRALSHGCFRLERAKELATYLVSNDTLLFPVDSLQYYLKQKEQKRVNINPHLPIHIRYYTCEADSNGVIFYDDVYGRDEKMIHELMK